MSEVEVAAGESSLPPFVRRLRAVDGGVQRVEVGVCLAALAVMVLLAFAQVFLRQFRGIELGPLRVPQPVAWFDNIARHLVIWVGVLGASLAAAEGRHIAIEAFPKLLGVRGRRRVEVVTTLAALAITAVLLALSLIYMLRVQVPDTAHLFEVEALGLRVHRWPFLVVVPLALAIMCARFGLRVLEALVLDDAAYEALRREGTDKDVEAVESRQEEQEVDLLVDSARLTAGGGAPMDRASARAEVRRALKSERVPAALPTCVVCERPASKEARRACDRCEAWHHVGCWELRGGCARCETDAGPSTGPGPGAAPRASGHASGGASGGAAAVAAPRRDPTLRSTDEIPVYRELADDEDLLEPEARRGAALIDSSEEIDPAALDEELAHEADAAVDAVADTERLRLDRDVPDDPDQVEVAEARAATHRLPRGELPGAEGSQARPQVVLLVRRPGEAPQRTAGGAP